MMKKKIKIQEEEKENINTYISDNKDITSSHKDHGDNNSEESASDKSTQSSGDIKTEEAPVTDKVEMELKETVAKLAEMQDKYIRLSAEFDNYRKRTLREKMDLSKYAAEDLFHKIIPLMDDFDRALAHMDTTTDCAAMKDGIDLIYNKFSAFFKQNGIKEIESMNTDFNVDLHEAIAKIPVQEEEKKGKIVDVVEKGYYIHDKILRHAKLVVGE